MYPIYPVSSLYPLIPSSITFTHQCTLLVSSSKHPSIHPYIHILTFPFPFFLFFYPFAHPTHTSSLLSIPLSTLRNPIPSAIPSHTPIHWIHPSISFYLVYPHTFVDLFNLLFSSLLSFLTYIHPSVSPPSVYLLSSLTLITIPVASSSPSLPPLCVTIISIH